MDLPATGQPLVCFQQPDRDYRQNPSISQSEAKEMLVSPAHWLHRYGPNAAPFISTPAMRLGSAFHARVLEPADFEGEFCRKADAPTHSIATLKKLLDLEGISYKSTTKKADLVALAFPDGEPKDSRTVLTDEDWSRCFGMAEAIRSHDYCGMWFDPGQKDYRKFNEVSLYAKTHQGLHIKGRLDRLNIDGGKATILDLKTTDDASLKSFQRSVVKFKYDLQAAWYSRLVGLAHPDLEVEFLFCVIEKSPPHGICVYRASDSILDHGNRLMDKALNLFGERQALNDYPAYPPLIQDLELPSWAFMEDDDQCIEF